MPKQKNTALAKRVAELEQAVADLGELHVAELAALSAQRAAADPAVKATRAAEAAKDGEWRAAIQAVRRAKSAVAHVITPLRNGLRYGGLFPSSGTPLRNALPALATALDGLRAMVAQDPRAFAERHRAEGEKCLREAEAFWAQQSELLAEFDQRLAEREATREAARRPRPGNVA